MTYDPVKQARLVGKWVPKSHQELVRLEERRYEYALSPESVVFDLGAFDGKWADTLLSKHSCHLFAFEPLKSHYEQCCKLLKSRAKVFPFGLAPERMEVEISVEKDASSMFCNNTGSPENKQTEKCILEGLDTFLDDHEIDQIGLLKMNIEGAEFDLLEFLLDSGLINRINNLQVQFHEFMPDCVSRRDKIRKRLSITHKVSWDYPWVMESWEKK